MGSPTPLFWRSAACCGFRVSPTCLSASRSSRSSSSCCSSTSSAGGYTPPPTPRPPPLLVGFPTPPVLFVLLFVYVFGGAIKTPGFDYVDFLMPGIIVQSILFGGFVPALGLSDDLKKGLIDRFRSLPMTRSALLTGRTLGDVVTNIFPLVVRVTVGLLIGVNFSSSVGEVVAGILLLLLIGYAFSWVFAFIGLSSSSPEASNAYGFTIRVPVA